MKIKINELIENIAIGSSVTKIITMSILFFVIILLGYWFDISTKLTDLQSLNIQHQSLIKDIKSKYAETININDYQQQLMQIKVLFNGLLKKLPTTLAVPSLLDDISKAGIINGLTFVLFKPGIEIKKGFYAELPIQISVIGNYHQLAKFVNDLEGLHRIIILQNFVIRPMTNRDIQNFSQNQQLQVQLLFTVTAKVYMAYANSITQDR